MVDSSVVFTWTLLLHFITSSSVNCLFCLAKLIERLPVTHHMVFCLVTFLCYFLKHLFSTLLNSSSCIVSHPLHPTPSALCQMLPRQCKVQVMIIMYHLLITTILVLIHKYWEYDQRMCVRYNTNSHTVFSSTNFADCRQHNLLGSHASPSHHNNKVFNTVAITSLVMM